MPHKYLAKEFEDLARSSSDAKSVMQRVSERIHAHIPRYNWVGFYLLDQKDPETLVLGPNMGSFTPNPRISVNQGLCGAAFSTGRVVVADNVAEDPRYLRTSDMVKSQISVPVTGGGKPMAVFNVESYFMSTFKPTVERAFVETCARIIAGCVERTGARNFVGV